MIYYIGKGFYVPMEGPEFKQRGNAVMAMELKLTGLKGFVGEEIGRAHV